MTSELNRDNIVTVEELAKKRKKNLIQWFGVICIILEKCKNLKKEFPMIEQKPIMKQEWTFSWRYLTLLDRWLTGDKNSLEE